MREQGKMGAINGMTAVGTTFFALTAAAVGGWWHAEGKNPPPQAPLELSARARYIDQERAKVGHIVFTGPQQTVIQVFNGQDFFMHCEAKNTSEDPGRNVREIQIKGGDFEAEIKATDPKSLSALGRVINARDINTNGKNLGCSFFMEDGTVYNVGVRVNKR
jgi:hypothetical protein